MAKVNVTPEELKELSRTMRRWEQKLSSLNSELENRVRNMSGWKDPQHTMFLNAIEMTAGHIRGYAETMRGVSESLSRYAKALDDGMKTFRANINSRTR